MGEVKICNKNNPQIQTCKFWKTNHTILLSPSFPMAMFIWSPAVSDHLASCNDVTLDVNAALVTLRNMLGFKSLIAGDPTAGTLTEH